jgi:hypothetical protein
MSDPNFVPQDSTSILENALIRHQPKVNTKADNIDASSASKLAKLNKAVEANTQKLSVSAPEPLGYADANIAERMRRAVQSTGALVGDNDLNTISGGALNTGAAIAVGGARIAGNMAGAANNENAGKLLSKLSDPVRMALTKENKGIALSSEEEALLNQQQDIAEPVLSKFGSGISYTPEMFTNREIFQQYGKELENAQIAKDYLTKDTAISRSFNTLNREKLTADLDSFWEEGDRLISDANGAFDTTVAATKLAGNTIGALWDNPMATIEYAAESLPNVPLALNPVTAAANSTAYSSDLLATNLRNLSKDGNVVSKDKQTELGQEATVAGALEYLANVATAGAAGVKLVTKATSKPIADGAKKAGILGVLEDVVTLPKYGKNGEVLNSAAMERALKEANKAKAARSVARKEKATEKSVNKVRGDVVQGDAIAIAFKKRAAAKAKGDITRAATKKSKQKALDAAAALAKEESKSNIRKTTESLLSGTLKVTSNLGNRSAKVSGAAIVEAGTEGFQTAAELDALGQDFNYKEDAKKIYQGAAIGLGASSATTLPGQALSVLGDSTKSAVKTVANKTIVKVVKNRIKEKALDNTIKSGEYNQYVESALKETLSNNNKNGVRSALDTITKRYDAVSKKGSADLSKSSELLKAYTETVTAAFNQENTLYEEREKTTDPKKIKEINKKIGALQDVIENNDLKKMQIKQESLVKTKDTVKSITAANKRDAKFEIDAHRIFDTNEYNPSALNTEQMTALLSSDKWTSKERAQLEASAAVVKAQEDSAAFSEEGKLKTKDQVHGEVIAGKRTPDPKTPNVLGSNNYRQMIFSAISEGNTEKVKAIRDKFQSFAQRHIDKAAVFKTAYAPYARRTVAQESRGNTATPATQAELEAAQFIRDNYKTLAGPGFEVVNTTAGPVVQSIQLESAVLAATLAEVDVAIANGKREPVVTEEITPTKVKLTKTGKHTSKDQVKSDQANKFIGVGSEKSSTNQYAKDWGDNANTGSYESTDTVFISAEGNRSNRVDADLSEVDKAITAGATIITDTSDQGNSKYNEVGEGKVQEYLSSKGYTSTQETIDGHSFNRWNKVTPTEDNVTEAVTEPPATQEPQEQVEDVVAEPQAEATVEGDVEPEPSIISDTPVEPQQTEAATKLQEVTGRVDAINKQIADIDEQLSNDNAPKRRRDAIIALGLNSNSLTPENKITIRSKVDATKKSLLNDKKKLQKEVDTITKKELAQAEAAVVSETFADDTESYTDKARETIRNIIRAGLEVESVKGLFKAAEGDKEATKDVHSKLKEAKDALNKLRTELKVLLGTAEKFSAAQEIMDGYTDTKFGRWFQVGKPKGVIGNVSGVIARLKVLPELALAYMQSDFIMSSRKSAAIKDFVGFAETFSKVLNDLSPKNILDIHVHNRMNAAFIKDGFLTESTLAAMSATAYSFLAFESKGTINPSPTDMASLLGLASKDDVGKSDYFNHSDMGVSRIMLANSMGRDIASALGIKYNQETTNADKQSELHTALGNFVLGALQHKGFVELHQKTVQSTLKTKDGKPLKKGEKGDVVDRYLTGVRVATLEDGKEMIPTVQSKIDINENTDRIVGELLSPSKAATAPSLAPVLTTADKLKNTVRNVASTVSKMLLQAQAKPWGLSEQTDNIMKLFDGDQLDRVLGLTSKEDLNKMTESNRKMHLAKNSAIQKDWDNLQSYRNSLKGTKKGLATPFYFSYAPWKNLRVGITNTLVNPQSSKIVRGLVGLKKWTTKVSLDDQITQDNFLYGIAQGLDFKVKGLGADKLTMPTLLAALTKELNISELDGVTKLEANENTSLFVEAAQAIHRLNTVSDISTEEMAAAKEIIVNAIEKGGENTHTLLALTNLGRFLDAKKNGKESFTSDIWIELDGITNGPAIGLIQFGNHDMAGLLEKAGVYSDERRSNGEFKESGENDMYETLQEEWSSSISAMMTTAKANNDVGIINGLNAIKHFMGSIKRGTAKGPLMTNVYGAGLAGILDDFGEALLTDIDNEIEKVVNDDSKTTAQKNKELAKINKFISYLSGRKDNLVLNGDPKFLLTKEGAINFKTQDAIKNYAAALHTDALGTAIDSMFEGFKDNRAEYNGAMQSMNEAFIIAYKQMVAKKTKELTESGSMQKGDYLPQVEIDKIIELLQPLMPATQISFSDTANEQLQVSKTEMVTKNPGDKKKGIKRQGDVVTQFSKPLNNNGSSTLTNAPTTVSFVEYIASGAAIQFIHSIDATIALKIFTKYDVLNVFDGFPSSVENVAEVAKALNEAMHDLMNERHVYRELAETLEKSQEALAQLVEGGHISPNKKMVTLLAEARNKVMLVEVMTEKPIQEFKDSIEHVNHYSFEGAGFETPLGKANREKREANDQRGPVIAPTPVTPAPVIESNPTPTAVSENEWGKLSAASTNEDAFSAELESQFSNESQPVSAKVFLTNLLSTQENNSKRLVLLKLILPLLGDDVNLTIINEDTPYNESLGTLRGALGGWRSSTRTVYLKSSDYAESGTNIETVSHEFLHAITSDVINGVKNKTITDPKIVKAVADLESLLNQVKFQMGRNVPYNIRFGAISNVKEFIAYGLTNPEFHRRLKGITVKNRGTLVTGFNAFVDAVTRLVFGKATPERTNALTQLIELTGTIASSQAPVNPTGLNNEIDLQRIERMTSEEMLNALDRGSRSDEHVEHITAIQTNLVNSIAGVEGADLRNAEENLGDELDTYLESLATNKGSFVSTIHRLFKMTAQEAYVAEQLEAVFDSDLMAGSNAMNHVQRLWEQAKQLPVEAFLDHPSQVNDRHAMKLAAARRKFIFDVKGNRVSIDYSDGAGRATVDNRSDYRKRFSILASTHAPLRAELAKLDGTRVANSKVDSSFMKQLSIALNTVIEHIRSIFEERVNATGALSAQMDSVLKNVATVNRKKRRRIANGPDLFTKTQDYLDSAGRKLFAKAASKMNIEGARKSDNKFVSLAGNLVDIVSNDKGQTLIDTIYDFSSKVTKSRHSLILNIVEEMRGETPNNSKLMQLLRWANRDNEQQRRFVKEQVSEIINKSFSSKLDDAEQTALTKVFVQGDLESLLNEFGLNGIETFLTDNAALDAEIKRIEKELKNLTEGKHDYYANQAEALGKYMVTNKTTFKDMPKNAFSISTMPGTEVLVSEMTAKSAESLIDTLASLQAITFMQEGDKQLAVEVLRTENNRTDLGNGVDFTLKQHRALKKESLARNFIGSERLMTKGHVHEITNHNLTVKWALAGSVESKQLLAQGYTANLEDIKRDKDDPETKEATMYVIEDGGMAQYLTGVFSFTAKSTKGKTFDKSAKEVGSTNTTMSYSGDLNKLKLAGNKENRQLLNQRIHARDVNSPSMLAVYNPSGDVVTYRYEMSEEVRENILEKNYKLSDVLGGLAGSIVDKETTETINVQVIDVLNDQYTNESIINQRNYVKISANSSEPEIKEIWDMMPYDARQYARETFGGTDPHIMIRKEHMNLVFGYRKSSIANLWDGRFDGRTMFSHVSNHEYADLMQHAVKFALDNSVGKVLGAKLAIKLRSAEDAHKMLISMVKDTFVVKNIFTTTANIMSNAALLSLSGVPIRHIIRDQAIAWKGAQDYNMHKKELAKLQNNIQVLQPTGKTLSNMQSRINELNHRMSSNPVSEMMEAGMFQTIVEDIDATIDPYSYKSKLMRKVGKRVDNVLNEKDADGNVTNVETNFGKNVKAFGKNLFITQDTKLYKFINHPIQMSDFAARYTQFKYLTETKTEKLSKKDAFKAISENFIQYDAPTNKLIQYLNDMGLLMFTKYTLRIIKPVFNLFSDRPATALLNMAAQSIAGFTSPVDSIGIGNILGRFVNPWESMINAPDEIATLNLLLHVTDIK